MATKYAQIYNQMVEENQELFEQFQNIHDQYTLNPQANQDKFNQIGEEVTDVIQKYERILCRKSDRSGYGTYTSKLSEKFWDHIRKQFPLIDNVGLITG